MRTNATARESVAVAALAGLGIALFLALLVLPIASLVLRIPLPALLAGAAMTWARALGEFGATITFAGNLPGVTQTMPLAVYIALQTDLEALLFGDRIAVLEAGQVVQTGPREDLLRHPRSGHVAGLMGLNFFSGRVVSRGDGEVAVVETPEGRVRVAGPIASTRA